MPEREACKVAHHEITRPGGRDHDSVPVFCPYLRGYGLYPGHVLGNLGTKVGAVYHAVMGVRVGPVHNVPVERERGPCLDCRLKDKPDYILDSHCPA